MMLGFFLIAPALYAQEAEDSAEPEVRAGQQAQQREARRLERQRQIGSLSDEQRQALRDRKRIRQAKGAGQGSQRPQRRRPQAGPSRGSAESASEEPT